ncbi:MAG: MlaD family protein [Chitinophagaceae bacterium]
MKINNETKVGILTIVALGLLIVGFNYLKGKDVFNRSTKIYAVFEKLGSLTQSNEVKINGYVIGKVEKMQPTDANLTGIRITINLTEKDVNIPANSVAYISAGLLGSSYISIEKGDATTYLKDGDILQTRNDNGLFGDISSEIPPTLVKIRQSLDSLNRVFGNVNNLFNSDAKNNLQQMLANLNMSTNSLNKMLDPKTSTLAKSLDNIQSITDNLRKNNDSIGDLINNAKRFTQNLSQLDVKKIGDSLESTIASLKSAVQKISSTDGTLGALINDKKLYNKLNDVILSAEILLDDIRTHPKRYVNISVFGKKDKGGELTSPTLKDTIPR